MDFPTLIERIGFPAAIVAFGGFAVWRVMVWFSTDVAKPLIETHTKFVTSVDATNKDNALSLKAIVNKLVVEELKKP